MWPVTLLGPLNIVVIIYFFVWKKWLYNGNLTESTAHGMKCELTKLETKTVLRVHNLIY